MTENFPGYISITFILTTFLTVGVLLFAVRKTVFDTFPAKLLVALIAFWLIFQSILGIGGFYLDTSAVPPQIFLFGILPAVAVVALYFLFFRKNFIERLPIKELTILHAVRIPVEIVLYWLYLEKMVPQEMTFVGWNYDILSGVLAIVVYFIVFRFGSEPITGMTEISETVVSLRDGLRDPIIPGSASSAKNKTLVLAGFNIIGLALLINIVSIAVLSTPSPLQQLAFDQPNRAVLLFPYVFLPTVVVPIVLFSHLTALYKTLLQKPKHTGNLC